MCGWVSVLRHQHPAQRRSEFFPPLSRPAGEPVPAASARAACGAGAGDLCGTGCARRRGSHAARAAVKALPVLDRRRSGVLLHPTALIDEHAGLGALGRAARAFIDWLAAAAVSVWQVLHLGPVGLDLSPYWVRSDQAGNPALIDLREAPEAAQARGDYQDFCGAEQGWLEGYVLYTALSQAHEAA